MQFYLEMEVTANDEDIAVIVEPDNDLDIDLPSGSEVALFITNKETGAYIDEEEINPRSLARIRKKVKDELDDY